MRRKPGRVRQIWVDASLVLEARNSGSTIACIALLVLIKAATSRTSSRRITFCRISGEKLPRRPAPGIAGAPTAGRRDLSLGETGPEAPCVIGDAAPRRFSAELAFGTPATSIFMSTSDQLGRLTLCRPGQLRASRLTCARANA